MTTKDKTGDQLMASIRKTKTESAAPDNKPASVPAAATTTRKKAPVSAAPAAAKPTPRVAKKKVVAKPKPTPKVSATAASSYGSSKRVWPD